FGPHGHGSHHHTDGQPADDKDGAIHSRAEETDDLETWSELHEQVEGLPEDEREIVGLLYYEGLTQEDAAKVLGVSLATVKRLWRSVRLKLHKAVKGDEQEQ